MLIWHNSMTYNKPETIYYRLAEKLEKQTTDLVAKARKDYEELEIKKETGILAAEVHPEIFTYNTVHIPSPEELAAERERVAAEERAKAEEEEKKRIAEEKAQARREAASAKRQAKAAAAELKRQKSRERAAALRAKKAEEMTAKQETEETGTMPKDEKPDVKQDKIADRRRRTRSMGSEGLIAPTPQELENRKSSEARRLVWYSESEPPPIPGDTKGKRKERGWLYLDDDEEIQPRKRVRESTRDSKKANKQDHAVNIKHKQIVWARIRGFPPHPARVTMKKIFCKEAPRVKTHSFCRLLIQTNKRWIQLSLLPNTPRRQCWLSFSRFLRSINGKRCGHSISRKTHDS